MPLDNKKTKRRTNSGQRSLSTSLSIRHYEHANANRYQHTALYCSKTKGILLFGGTDIRNRFYKEVIAVSMNAKQVKKMKTSGRQPPALSQHACVMWGNKMIVYGGKQEDGQAFGDLYILNTDTRNWSRPRISKDSVLPRFGHCMELITIDTSTHYLLLVGGVKDEQDVYMMKLTGNSWTDLTWVKYSYEVGPNPARDAASCSTGLKMFLHGGRSIDEKDVYDDLYMFEVDHKGGLNIVKVETKGQKPLARYGHKMAYINARNALLLSGGYDIEGDIVNDAWVYLIDENSWKVIDSSDVPFWARSGHSWTSVLNGSRIISIGGHSHDQSDALDFHILNTNQLIYEGFNIDLVDKDQVLAFDLTSELLALPDDDLEDSQSALVKFKGPKKEVKEPRDSRKNSIEDLQSEDLQKDMLVSDQAQSISQDTKLEVIEEKKKKKSKKSKKSKEKKKKKETIASNENSQVDENRHENGLIDTIKETAEENIITKDENDVKVENLQVELENSLPEEDEVSKQSNEIHSASPLIDDMEPSKAEISSPIMKFSESNTRRRSHRVSTLNGSRGPPSPVITRSNRSSQRLSVELVESMDVRSLKSETKSLIQLLNNVYTSIESLVTSPSDQIDVYKQKIESIRVLLDENLPKLGSFPKPTSSNVIQNMSRNAYRNSMDFNHSAEREIQKLKGNQDISLPDGCEDNEKNAHDRSLSILELLDTERLYIDKIKLLVDDFRTPLDMRGILPEKDILTIFSNINVILPFNQEFLASLELMKDLPSEEQNVGGVFLAMADYLKMYTVYCTAQNKSVVRLRELLNSDGMLQRFVQDKAEAIGIHPSEIFSLLIQPIQRVCRYPLLLKQIFKCTPSSHPDFENLFYAIAKVDQVVSAINEGKRRIEAQMKMIEIDQTLSWEKKIPTGFQFIDPSRGLIDELHASMNSNGTQIVLYLFNDILLIGKVVSGSRRVVRHVFHILAIEVNTKDDNEGVLIISWKKKSFSINVQKKDVRDHWVELLNRAKEKINMDTLNNKNIYELLTGEAYVNKDSEKQSQKG